MSKVWRFTRSGVGVPVVSTVEQVDPSGGDVTTVTGTNFLSVSSVTVDGTSCPFIALSSTKLVVVTPAKAVDTYTLAVTTPGGTSVATNNIVYFTNVDANTTLRLQRGNYVGDTYIDDSGNGRHFTNTTLYAPEEVKEPQFNETGTNRLDSAATLSNFVSAGGDSYSVSIMFRMRSLDVETPGVGPNPALVSDAGGYMGLYICDAWTKWYHSDTLAREIDLGVVSLYEWHVIDVECNAGTLRARLDGGTWSATVAGSALGSLASILRLASNYDGAHRINGDIREISIHKVARGDTWFDQNLARLRVKHGFKSAAGEPEIDSYDDVHDPAGGSRVVVRGRNLTGASGYIENTALTNVKVFGSMPEFRINNELDLAGTANTYHNPTTLSGWALLRVSRVKNNNTGGSIFLNDSIVATGGTAEYGVVLRSSGNVCLFIYNGAGYTTVETSIPLAEWTLVQWKYDGANLKIRVNGATRAAVAATASVDLAGTLHLGRNYNADAAYALDAVVAEIGLTDTVLSDANEDSTLGGVNFDYGLNLGGVTAATFDRSSLSPTLLLKPGNYASGTWTATVGSNATEATNPPRVSTGEFLVATMPAKSASSSTIGNHPKCNGTTHKLVAGGTLDTYYNAASYSGWIVFNPYAVAGFSATVYTNDVLLGTSLNAWWVLTLKTDGTASIRTHDGVEKIVTVSGIRTNQVNVLRWRHSGTTLYLSANGGPYSSVALGSIGSSTDPMWIGSASAYSSNEFNGEIYEVGLSDTDLGTTNLDNVLGELQREYGVIWNGSVPPLAFNRASLSLTAYWKPGSYAVGTWSATASAGTSGSNSATEATNPPDLTKSDAVTNPYPLVLVNASGEAANTNAIVSANPGSIGGNVWWLRANTGVTESGGDVTNWADESGIGDTNRDVVPTTNPVPVAASASYGGKKVVGPQYGFASRFLRNPAVWSETYPVFSLGVIGHSANITNHYYTYGSGTSYNAIVVGGSGSTLLFNGDATQSITGLVTAGSPRTDILGVFNGASSKLYVSGVRNTGTFTQPHTLGDERMYVGSYESSGFGVDGLAEVYAYSRDITVNELRTLRHYRNTYYGRAA